MRLLLRSSGYDHPRKSSQKKKNPTQKQLTNQKPVCTVTVVALRALNACVEAFLHFYYRVFLFFTNFIVQQQAVVIIICATPQKMHSGL